MTVGRLTLRAGRMYPVPRMRPATWSAGVDYTPLVAGVYLSAWVGPWGVFVTWYNRRRPWRAPTR